MQINEIINMLKEQQTTLYAIILRDDIPLYVTRALITVHGNLNDAIHDLMSSEDTGR